MMGRKCKRQGEERNENGVKAIGGADLGVERPRSGLEFGEKFLCPPVGKKN